MKSWTIGLSLLVMTLVIAGPSPLGVDGLVTTPSPGLPHWARLATPGAVLAILCAALQVQLASAAWHKRITLRCHLLAAWLLAAGMTFGLTSTGDTASFTLAKSVSFQGYAEDGARFKSAGAVLSEYNARHSELFPHSATHPPAPVLLYRFIGEAARVLAEKAPNELGFSNSKTLELAIRENLIGGLVILVAWLWLWPLATLARIFGNKRAATLAIAFAAGLPSMHVIAPMSDILHPLLATGAALAAAHASRNEYNIRRFGFGLLAGILASTLALFSFGNLAALPLLATVLIISRQDRNLRALALPALGVLLGLLATYTGLLALGYNYGEGLRLSLDFHASGVTARRDYWPFVFSSPYTFLLWLSPPILIGASSYLRSSPSFPTSWLVRTTLLLVVLLSVAGTSRGETERLWLALTPFLLVPAALAWSTESERFPRVSIACTFALTVLFQALTGQYA